MAEGRVPVSRPEIPAIYPIALGVLIALQLVALVLLASLMLGELRA